MNGNTLNFSQDYSTEHFNLFESSSVARIKNDCQLHGRELAIFENTANGHWREAVSHANQKASVEILALSLSTMHACVTLRNQKFLRSCAATTELKNME